MLNDLFHATPLLVLLATSLIVLILDAFRQEKLLVWVTGAGILLSALLALPLDGSINGQWRQLYFSDMIYFGGTASAIHVFLLASAFSSLFFIEDYFSRVGHRVNEIYTLLLFTSIGMIMMATANDLIIVFVGLEILSVSLYILAGSFRHDVASNEAGVKYFLLGAFASAFLLYGIALFYGASGSTQINQMDFALLVEHPFFFPAAGLFLVGLFFKIAAFPFHSWTPDVYTGAPTAVVGFMGTGSKMAAFITLAVFLMHVLPHDSSDKLATLIGVFALLSMVYGNVVAVQQSNIKRMLAYSSIAHTGYMLLGLLGGGKGFIAVVFYMVVYTFMTVGAFGIIAAVERKAEDNELDNWKGLGLRNPLLGAAMSIFMFSLAGMPPLAGFMGKYQVFISAIEADVVVLATLGILTSVIGAYYYLRVIVYMYFLKPEDDAVQGALHSGLGARAGALLLSLVLLVLGIYPSLLYHYLDRFASSDKLITEFLPLF